MALSFRWHSKRLSVKAAIALKSHLSDPSAPDADHKNGAELNLLVNATSKLPAGWRWTILSRSLGRTRAARALGMKVGENCRIISCVVAAEYDLVEIGNRVTVSSEVLFITHDGAGWLTRDERGRRYRLARIKVGDDCFIGARSILMPGVELGERCIVAAGSVVTKSVPSGSVVGGNPARVIGSFANFRERTLREWATERQIDTSFRAPMQRPVPNLRNEHR